MIDRITPIATDHLITIENPIEFLHRDKRSFIISAKSKWIRELSTALRPPFARTRTSSSLAKCATLNHFHRASRRRNRPPGFLHVHTLDATETIPRIIAVFPRRSRNRFACSLPPR